MITTVINVIINSTPSHVITNVKVSGILVIA